MISAGPQRVALKPLGSWPWCLRKGLQVPGQRHLLENTLLFSPYPIFPDFQGGRGPQRKNHHSSLLEQDPSRAFRPSTQGACHFHTTTARLGQPFLVLS